MAKGINLGLESLLSAGNAAPVLSFETLDNLSSFFCAADDVMECTRQLSACLETLDNLRQIRSCISKYGVTQSLEALYGENFRSAASMEEDAKAAEKGIMAKIGEWFRKLWEKIQNFFGWLFKTGAAARREIGKAKFTKEFTIKIGDKEETIKSASDFERVRKDAIAKYDGAKASKEKMEKDLKAARDKKDKDAMQAASKTIAEETKKLKEAAVIMWKLIKNGTTKGPNPATNAPGAGEPNDQDPDTRTAGDGDGLGSGESLRW